MREDRNGTIATWFVDEDAADPFYTSFEEISQDFLHGYRRLAEEGMVPAMIAHAMLGAAINLYEVFGMTRDLPSLLRGVADRLEYDGYPS